MIDNIKLFEISIKNEESYVDEYYVKSNKSIITDDRKKLNKLMKANVEILDNISAYKIAVESNNVKMQKTVLNNIALLLKTAGINNSEFTSYWAIKDMSHSSYESFKNTPFIQIEFLKSIIPEFIKDRHLLYKIHGYSFSSIQAIKDSKAHKKNGGAGNKKITELFEKYGFSHFKSSDILDFNKKDKIFICPDKTDKILFKRILGQYKVDFNWSRNHENKQTDFLFKIDNKIFIMEHKHMKESGGGQGKQMSEIINFISYKDDDVHYVSFLDGIYFNVIASKSVKAGKPFEQRKSIMQNLMANKQNYFVNTNGFIALMSSLVRGR